MIVQITNQGTVLQEAATAPLVMTSFVLGAGFNYVPDQAQNALHGNTVYTGLPGLPVIANQNTIKYPLYLGDTLGPFTYGEIGLFYNTTLYAVCVFDTLVTKNPLDPIAHTGGAVVNDLYVPIVSTNYEMYANNAQANAFKASVLSSVAELPYSRTTTTNLFVIQALPKAFLAYTDRVGEWHFDGWRTQGVKTVVSGDLNTLVVNQNPNFYIREMMMVQVMSGQDFGLCREIASVSLDGNGDLVLGLTVPLPRSITAGTQLTVLSSTNELFQGGTF